jgi:phage antirepressor YoqD-like protein
MSVKEAAKIMGVGYLKLFSSLRKRYALKGAYNNTDAAYNQPQSEYVTAGYFMPDYLILGGVKGDGTKYPAKHVPRITRKGLEWIFCHYYQMPELAPAYKLNQHLPKP